MSIPLYRFGALVRLCAALTLACQIGLSAAEEPPQVSKDGLQLMTHTRQRLVYVKPGATFSQYDKMMIVDCYVEFQKDWQRNYNSNVMDPSRQVTDQKVQQMKSILASEFKKVFTTELQKAGYQVTTDPASDVLLLRPAIIDVQVTAPDIMSAGFDVSAVTSAGSGTFYLELWDPTTNTILARAMDAQADRQPFARQANSVTNMEAADIILKYWADDLIKHLDAVRGKTSGRKDETTSLATSPSTASAMTSIPSHKPNSVRNPPLGVSQQIGWTGVIARLMQLFGTLDPQTLLQAGLRPRMPSAA